MESNQSMRNSLKADAIIPKQKYWVVGSTHIDLAWKKDQYEMAEMLESFVVRLLDALENNPTFTYVIEQAAHFRCLKKRRPDLIERLKVFLGEGRLEMVGGMASTMETNVPNGECFVRNQMLGMEWVRQNFGVEIKTGWLLDTFGTNAQVPQILKQFGIHRLMANRFGGSRHHDVFLSKGLDGTKILVAGRDVFSGYLRPGHMFLLFEMEWKDLDRVFLEAAKAEGPGPFLVTAYAENETQLQLRPIEHVKRLNREQGKETWKFAVLHEFFDALEKTGKEWPVEDGDLNPEFTGTFSQRILIRMRNRKVENLLLEVEKWMALAGLDAGKEMVEEAWWLMAFNQFHDVFTGSHPTKIFRQVLENYDCIERTAVKILERAFAEKAGDTTVQPHAWTVTVFNGLPWNRQSLVSAPLPMNTLGVEKVSCDGKTVPFEVREGNLTFLAQIPPVGWSEFLIENGKGVKVSEKKATGAMLENEFIRFEWDDRHGIKRLECKKTGKVLMENAGDFLVIQKDEGSFQIENPVGPEVPAATGSMKLLACELMPFGQRLIVSGAFPALDWTGSDGRLEWEIEFELLQDAPRLDLKLKVLWKGEASRIRLKLSTSLDTSEGVYEIPFGTVRRKPSGIRFNARGEWPAHRFVAIEDGSHGLALVNTGTPGVEVNGGTIWTTILRAPKVDYSGMIPDDTSSQHGEHRFDFAIVPYAGTWKTSMVARAAQELNNLVHVVSAGVSRKQPRKSHSLMSLDTDQIVLSSVKGPEDGSKEIVVRLYETTGQACTANLNIQGAHQAWNSNLREQKLEPLPCADGVIGLAINPFEIKTVRVSRG